MQLSFRPATHCATELQTAHETGKLERIAARHCQHESCADRVGRPLGDANKDKYLPSGDQRGDKSRRPLLIDGFSPVAGENVPDGSVVPVFLSFTTTLTNATRGSLSGEFGDRSPRQNEQVFLGDTPSCARQDRRNTHGDQGKE